MESNELEGELEKSIEKEVKKPGFLRRNLKKIALGTAGLILAGVGTAAYLGLRRDGKIIKGNLDGKIDKEYYHSLALEYKTITDISQIEDLVAEVYHLTTGKKIEDDFRFTIYEQGKEPLRVKISQGFKVRQSLGGISWRNGDIYLKQKNFRDILHMLFHELGHKPATTQEINSYEDINKEPFAEKNVIDSIISLSYLDQELGYLSIKKYISKFSHDEIHKIAYDKWRSAETLNFLKVINKNVDIRKNYSSNDGVSKIIKENIEGKNGNELFSGFYKGFLSAFKEKFGNKPDFKEKEERLKSYISCGLTDNVYEKLFFTREEIIDGIQRKKDFLKKDVPEFIRKDIKISIDKDYNVLETDDEMYEMHINKIKKGSKAVGYEIGLRYCIDHALKNDNQEEAEKWFSMLEKKGLKFYMKKYKNYF